MAIFGEALNPTLWQGRIYKRYPNGCVVQDGANMRFLRTENSMVLESPPFADAALWQRWREQYRRPVRAEPEADDFTEPEPLRRPKRALAPAGGVAVVPVFLRLLTIKLGGNIVIKGTEEEGINIENNDVTVGDLDGGTATITVKSDDA